MVATAPKPRRALKGTKMLGVTPGVVEFKLLDTPGAFRATFALFNVMDLDRDVTVKGAFKTGARVRIAQWGHNWGSPAIGTGTIGADDERAWVDGQFNLEMAAGKETYESVKALGELQQWSYGFDIEKWSVGKFEGQEVRFLESMTVHEISPVMLGAQPLTSTDRIKSADQRDTFQQIFDECYDRLARGESLDDILFVAKNGSAASRAKEGRRNSASDADRLQKAHDLLVEAGASCESKDDENTDDDDDGSGAGKASKGSDPKAPTGSRETLAARIALELLELDD